MPDAPATSRPDVKAIAARAEAINQPRVLASFPAEIHLLVRQDIPALIAHIEALEEVVAIARRRCGRGSMNCVGSRFVKDALAALGDGDG